VCGVVVTEAARALPGVAGTAGTGNGRVGLPAAQRRCWALRAARNSNGQFYYDRGQQSGEDDHRCHGMPAAHPATARRGTSFNVV